MIMTSHLPLVSVGLPVYNGDRYLERAIQTILDQDLADLELVISDNGSTDATAEICRSFAQRDPRVTYVRSEVNRGAAWNFNRVFELATGTYFKWIAHDDEHAPTYLSRCVEALENDPSTVLVHSRTRTIDADGQAVGVIEENFEVPDNNPVARWRRQLRYEGGCYHVFGLIRADALRQTGLIGRFSDSDLVLLAELALHGKFREVPDTLFLHRDHPDRSIYRHPDQRSRENWFDPSRPDISLPMWRFGYELSRAVTRAPLPPVGKLRCRMAMQWWVRRHWVHLLKNPPGAVKHVLVTRAERPARSGRERPSRVG